MAEIFRLFTRLIPPLCLLSCLLVALSLLGGRLIPAPEQDSLLTTNPCTLPCVFGVVPRMTTRDDALRAFQHAVLRTTFLDPDLPAYDERGSASTESLLALLDLSNPDLIVRSVILYQMEDRHDLGVLSDYLLAGYQPTRVLSNCAGSGRLIIAIDEAGLFIQITLGARLDPNAVVEIFGTTGGTDGMSRALDTFACADETDWSGLAALWQHADLS